MANYKQLPLLTFLFALISFFSLTKAKYDINTIKRIQGCHKGTKVQGVHDLKLYLARFGYLDYQNNPSRATNDEFDQELEVALKSYQNFYNLNASGTLDGPTVSQMIMPRCGQPDKKSSHVHIHGTKLYSFFGGNPKWPQNKRRLTYAFINNYPDAYVYPVVCAFNTWTSGSSGYFRFFRVNDASRADIKISFESGDHRDGAIFQSNILAHAFPPTDGRFHYNADENWSVQPKADAFDLETVAVHEIGHILGLGHSNDPNAVMVSGIPPGVTKRGLNTDDIKGIRALYGL